MAGATELRRQDSPVWMKCELNLVKGKVSKPCWKRSLGLMDTWLSCSSQPRWGKRRLGWFISRYWFFSGNSERVFHETVWEMEQVPRMGILAAMIFHLVAVCSCLYVIIILCEMCTLAFPWRGHSSFTHIQPNFPISQVSLQECTSKDTLVL